MALLQSLLPGIQIVPLCLDEQTPPAPHAECPDNVGRIRSSDGRSAYSSMRSSRAAPSPNRIERIVIATEEGDTREQMLGNRQQSNLSLQRHAESSL